MILDPGLVNEIEMYRRKQAEGSMQIEDWKVVFLKLRAARSSAADASAASKRKTAAKAPVNTEVLKDSLRSLMKKTT